MNLVEERTIALAGVLQASLLVQSLAYTGQANDNQMQASLKSILVLDALNVASIFGGLSGVEMGLTSIKQGILGSPKIEDIEVLRYSMSLMQLQNQLYRDKAQFQLFSEQVERLSAVTEDELSSACSKIYQDFISVMRPQVLVQGKEGFLQQNGIPCQVRALLLAGIRSAVLWQQKDGGRLKLILQRGQFVNAAGSLLDQLT